MMEAFMNNRGLEFWNKFSFFLFERFLPAVLLASVMNLLLAAQNQEQVREVEKPRPPVTAEELAMTDLPEMPGAPAVCLYYEQIDDRVKEEIQVFRRIKILTPAGRDFANIEIPYKARIEEVKDLKVRVVQPDGSSREVKVETMEKVASRRGWFEYRVKTLAVPDITPGQIIEYEYKIASPKNVSVVEFRGGGMVLRLNVIVLGEDISDPYSLPGVTWDLQQSIYVRRARYKFEPLNFVGVAVKDKYNLAWVASRLKGVKPEIDETGLELEVSDIPPFEREEFMPPESSLRMNFKVYFLNPSIKQIQIYWERVASDWKQSYEQFMSRDRVLKKQIQSLVGGETDPEVKLRKIYEFVQSIKNLDYALDMSEKEWKKIHTPKNVAEVLKRKYGYKNQIAKTFAALAGAAGFETYLVRVATREDKLFEARVPLFHPQFDAEIVMVKVGGRFKSFDPGLPDCPYGVVHWSKTGTAAIVFEGGVMKRFETPVTPAEESVEKKLARFQLDEQGNLTGQIRVEYTGQEALWRKFDNREKDEIKVREILEEELRKKLPPGSRVVLKNLTGLKDSTTELTAEFEAEIAGVVHHYGDRLLLPVHFLTNSGQYPFRSAFRKYPIYFRYPFTQIDEITIDLPEGFEVEAVPGPVRRDSERTRFVLSCAQEEPHRLKVERQVAMKKNLFPVEDYIHLKDFYDFVQSRDEQQIILKRK